MRYVLAALLVCALVALPGAALPKGASRAVSAPKADQQTAKRAKAQTERRNNGLNGIHPLVGSGDY